MASDSTPRPSLIYRSILPLAAGGMGSVEVAVRTNGSFERMYAVKRLHNHLADDPDFVEMFYDEARLAGLVRHANVVSVLDVGHDERGPFMAMEYIEGVSLRELLAKAATVDEVMPVQLAVRIIRQCAAGLFAAHETTTSGGKRVELIHRDVSPHNILLGFDGLVRITDFGIAKALGRSTFTNEGVLKGKFGYMSPEQLRFEAIDQRSDLFALGVVFFETLTARRLYPTGRDSVQHILNDPPPDLGDERDDIPDSLVELCIELLAKDPDQRPADAGEVVARLDEILEDLIVREGSQDLASYLRAVFPNRQRDHSQVLSDALSVATEGATSELRVAHPPSARPWQLLAIVAMMTAAALLAWNLSSPEPTPASSPDSKRLAVTPAPAEEPGSAPEASNPGDDPSVETRRAPRRSPTPMAQRAPSSRMRTLWERDGTPRDLGMR
ncbi:MAG: protein kinase [Myxococcota bacterium]